nr:hypothetical protein [Tanacetum cinerariifolium]
MKSGEVDASEADQANGPAGLSQAQWESWDKYKGVPEEEAKRRYVAKVAEITGDQTNGGTDAAAVPTDALTNAPMAPDAPLVAVQENDTTAAQPEFSPGQSTGGLRGDITADKREPFYYKNLRYRLKSIRRSRSVNSALASAGTKCRLKARMAAGISCVSYPMMRRASRGVMPGSACPSESVAKGAAVVSLSTASSYQRPKPRAASFC